MMAFGIADFNMHEIKLIKLKMYFKCETHFAPDIIVLFTQTRSREFYNESRRNVLLTTNDLILWT